MIIPWKEMEKNFGICGFSLARDWKVCYNVMVD